ncbi:MAG TPA: 3-dehydroquinate synthase [Terriglobales bacterium]|nr:3-dehydroquinate synthase [Terriglobales bacterium]
MQEILIRVEPRPYRVRIARGLLRNAGRELRRVFGRTPPRCFVVTVPPARRWARVVSGSLRRAKIEHAVLAMADGERAKALSAVESLAERLVRAGADRKSVLVGVGGGVTGDVTGFLASIYMRGIDHVQVPTTLLAQVDAAIGGKTGVNLAAGKNLLGSFHQPRLVLTDPEVLATLPERDFRAGLFEALKCGVIRDARIFDFMERERERLLQRDPKALAWLIASCVRVKAAVVAADERERGLRRILNFGHTVGHALEAATGYRRLRHGEAVGWGMIAAAEIGHAMGRTSAAAAGRIARAVAAYGPLPRLHVSAEEVLRRLAADKKTVDGATHFVLARRIGQVEIVPDVPARVVARAVERLRQGLRP